MDERENTYSKEVESRGERSAVLYPRIYVASLSDYNAARLHGEWIDADPDPGEIHARIKSMLATSKEPGAEEFAVHDYEDFGGFTVHEYESIDVLAQVAAGILEHGEAFSHWAERCRQEAPHSEFATELSRFDEAFLGRFDSLLEYAEQVADDLGLERSLEESVPDSLQHFIKIDYRALADELTADLSVVRRSSGVYIFNV